MAESKRIVKYILQNRIHESGSEVVREMSSWRSGSCMLLVRATVTTSVLRLNLVQDGDLYDSDLGGGEEVFITSVRISPTSTISWPYLYLVLGRFPRMW